MDKGEERDKKKRVLCAKREKEEYIAKYKNDASNRKFSKIEMLQVVKKTKEVLIIIKKSINHPLLFNTCYEQDKKRSKYG